MNTETETKEQKNTSCRTGTGCSKKDKGVETIECPSPDCNNTTYGC